MAMKRPLGSVSPPAECRDQLQMGPRTRVRDDGTSGSSFWKIMAALMFLGFRQFTGVGGPRGEVPWAGAGPTHGSTLTRGRGAHLPPGPPLRLSFGLGLRLGI